MRLHRPVSNYVEGQLSRFLYEDAGSTDLFTRPLGEEAFVPLSGITAKVYSVPLTVYLGGIAAVILELAEPRVRHGVWDHSIFPTDPVLRLKRTGLAAMVTFYAARSVAERMIAKINQRHAKIEGHTDRGVLYSASDPELLTWVQSTAAWGFIGAYHRYKEHLSDDQWTDALGEAAPAARAYGVPKPPASKAALLQLIAETCPDLEPSETLHSFLRLMAETPTLPGLGRHLQPMFVRAAVALLPGQLADKLELGDWRQRLGEKRFVRLLVAGSQLLKLRNHPRALAQQRISAASHRPRTPLDRRFAEGSEHS